MNLTGREKDKLLVAMAAIVAHRRLERGVKLNHPEAIALITDHVVEGARDGASVAQLMVMVEEGEITADQCEDMLRIMGRKNDLEEFQEAERRREEQSASEGGGYSL